MGFTGFPSLRASAAEPVMRTSSSTTLSSTDPRRASRAKRFSTWRKVTGCWFGGGHEEVMVEKISIDEVQPQLIAGDIKGSGLPPAALRFAMAAAKGYVASTSNAKGHRRMPVSADSVMDPFAAEWAAMEEEAAATAAKEQQQAAAAPVVWPDEVKGLLDLPDHVLRAMVGRDDGHAGEWEALGLACKRTSQALLPETRQTALLQKVGCKSVASLRGARVLFWQACDLSDGDMQTLAAWLERMPTPPRHLHALYLNANVISDRGCRALLDCRALDRLHHLSLASNLITDLGSAEIAERVTAPDAPLGKLHELNMRGNPLTEAARAQLRGMHDQNRMYVAI